MKDCGKHACAAGSEGSHEEKAKRVGVTYRNPYDQFDKWSGLGPRPHWLKKWISEGGTLEQLRLSTEQSEEENGQDSQGVRPQKQAARRRK